MTPLHWTSDATLSRWHHQANLWFKVPMTVAVVVVLPLGFWQDWLRKPCGALGLALMVPSLVAGVICQFCWREVERREYIDPVEWADEIGWFG